MIEKIEYYMSETLQNDVFITSYDLYLPDMWKNALRLLSLFHFILFWYFTIIIFTNLFSERFQSIYKRNQTFLIQSLFHERYAGREILLSHGSRLVQDFLKCTPAHPFSC